MEAVTASCALSTVNAERSEVLHLEAALVPGA